MTSPTDEKFITVEQLQSVLGQLQPKMRLQCGEVTMNLAILNERGEFHGYIDFLNAWMGWGDILRLADEEE